MLLVLFEHLDLLFCVCSFTLVAKYYFKFSDKLVPILDVCFFIQLIKLLLGINASYTSLRWARIAVILLFIPVTLLLLRNNQISLYQSSNFVLPLSNYFGSRTILLDNSTYLFCTFASAVNILSVYSMLLFEASSVIFSNPSHSNNTSILYSRY